MQQFSTAESIRAHFTISDRYNGFDDDVEAYYFIKDCDVDFADLSEKYSIICFNSAISNRGDLCSLTRSVIELDELSKKINELSSVITFPTLRSVCCDTDEVIEKLQFAMEYDYPYINENNVILEEVFNFSDDESNYLKGYYLDKSLYTPDEKKEDKKFRNIPEIEKYYKFCGKLQKLSYMCFGKLLKPNDAFNNFVLYQFSNESNMDSYDSFLYESLKYLNTDENPFLDIERLFQNFDKDSISETNSGFRRWS